jgi:2-polyprenyl-3-methyl-5-hydroxy-6-metoxy-1,4-benzoquinol methylase
MPYNENMEVIAKDNPYDHIAAEYDDLFGDQNPYYESVNRCEREVFTSWIKRQTDSPLALDVGCGTGFHTKWLAEYGFDAMGIDKSTEMIRIATSKTPQKGARMAFKTLDVKDIRQLPANSFSVVLCLGSVLNHFDDWREFALRVSALLVEGGLFLFSYDNVDGIDVVARAILRQFAGYSDAYIRDVVVGRIKARFGGESFYNHWRVSTGNGRVEIPLKYEHTNKWRMFLSEADLEICELRGTHLLDCFDRNLLKASAGINPSASSRNGVKVWLKTLDRFAAKRLHHIAANVVGVAVKRSY